jgi:NADH-quinone oxidoreductase subunit J
VIETVLLWLFAGTALAAAAMMIVLRHPMRVALALAATMLSLAGVYALLGVHVIAIFQVLIYVGAVMVFMVYAIMLLDVRDRSFTRRFSWLLLPGAAAVAAFLAILAHGCGASCPSRPRQQRRAVRHPALLDRIPERVLAAFRARLGAARRGGRRGARGARSRTAAAWITSRC